MAEQTSSMADSNQPTEWYLARDGQQHGPVTDAELGKIIELGYLRPTDLVWRQGMAEWAPAESVLKLPPKSPVAPAPPPPAARSQPAARPAEAQSAAVPEREPAIHHADDRGRGSAYHPAAGGAQRDTAPGPHQAAYAPGPANAGPQPRGNQRQQPYAPGTKHGPPRSGPIAGNTPHAAARAQGSGLASPVPGGRPQHQAGASVGHAPRAERDEREPEERSGFPWRTAAVLAIVAGLGAGAVALYKSGGLVGIPFVAAPSVSDAVPVVGRPKAAARDAASEQPAPASTVPTGPAGDVDASLQKSALWQKLKRDFPDWYQERVAEIARLSSESKSEREISAAMTRSLVELRRRHQADALASSPNRIKAIASSFVENLALLSRESTAACYGYISQGEVSPMIRHEQRPLLDAQLAVVFEAVAEGRKSPTKREPPRREDYDLLSTELGKRGWSAADLQLFTDARALSRAAPEKVCQMVQDWFAAQLAVEDEGVKIRLLGEALKPVVAG